MEKDDGRGIVRGDYMNIDRPIDRTTWASEVVSQWGTYLNNEVEKTKPKQGTSVLWWLGAASFVLKSPEATILIDNYYGPSMYTTYDFCGVCRTHGAESMDWVRLHPIVLDPFAIKTCDFHFSTHHHQDHCDIYAIKALVPNTKAKFAGPKITHAKLRNLGVPEDRAILVKPGDEIKVKDVTVEVLEASDRSAMITGKDKASMPETMDEVAVTYLFKTPGGNIFHLGDSLYSNMYRKIGVTRKVDVALLPFGTNAPGITDKMSAYDCFRVAQALNPRVLIPMHYDNWGNSQADPREVKDIVKMHEPGIHVTILQWGARFELPTDFDMEYYKYPNFTERFRWEYSWEYGNKR